MSTAKGDFELERAAVKKFASYSTPHPPQTSEPIEYFIGECYQKYDWLRDGRWLGHNQGDGAYLSYVKKLARSGWPQLGYLADFMETSTVPMKRRMLVAEDQHERFNRFHVVVIDLAPGQDFQTHEFWSASELESFLTDYPWTDSRGHARLFAIEDLSTTAIELFGSRFNLDPGFFRSHISDYTWFNIRDPWFETSTLPSRARASAHFVLKYIRPFYLPNASAKASAKAETGAYNVLRRMDFDDSTKSWADKKGSQIGLLRSSASCYLRPTYETDKGWLGFVILDPSVNAGYPLWGGHDGIRPPPSGREVAAYCDSRSPLRDFVTQVTSMSPHETRWARDDPNYLISPLLCSIPTYWLLCFEHIMNRLSLIEWEIEHEAHRGPAGLDESLKRLHPWRRRTVNFGNQIRGSIDVLSARFGNYSREWTDLVANFEMVEKRFTVLEAKVDKIMVVLTAMMSIQESKKAITNARDIARITYLAFIYVPMAFVASFLSMNTQFTQGQTTVYWVFFVIAVPLTAISLGLALFWKPLSRVIGRAVTKAPTPAEKATFRSKSGGI